MLQAPIIKLKPKDNVLKFWDYFNSQLCINFHTISPKVSRFVKIYSIKAKNTPKFELFMLDLIVDKTYAHSNEKIQLFACFFLITYY